MRKKGQSMRKKGQIMRTAVQKRNKYVIIWSGAIVHIYMGGKADGE